MVAAAIAFDLWTLRAERTPVAVRKRPLHPHGDGAVRRPADIRRPPAVDGVVPVHRARVTPVPALPEPSGRPHRTRRSGDLSAVRRLVVDLPTARHLASQCLHIRKALFAPTLGGRLGSGREPVPLDCVLLGLRAACVHLPRLRLVDAVVRDVVPADRLGAHLACHNRSQTPPCCSGARRPHDLFPFRDGLSGARCAGHLPVRFTTRPTTKTALRFIGRCCSARNVCVGVGSPVRFAASGPP